MGKFSLKDYQDYQERKENGQQGKARPSFLNLKNDGDEAIVRINYATPEDFERDFYTVHKVMVEGSQYPKSVYCLRESFEDSVSKCPLCSASDKAIKKLSTKFILHGIQYVKNDKGEVEVKPFIWERPVSLYKDILDAVNDAIEDGFYADDVAFNDMVFRIKRCGKAGDTDTSYKVKGLNPSIYKESVYAKDFSLFDEYNVLGNGLMKKSFEDLQYYVKNGSFPAVENAEEKEDKKVFTGDTSVTEMDEENFNEGKTEQSSKTEEKKPRRYTY